MGGTYDVLSYLNEAPQPVIDIRGTMCLTWLQAERVGDLPPTWEQVCNALEIQAIAGRAEYVRGHGWKLVVQVDPHDVE